MLTDYQTGRKSNVESIMIQIRSHLSTLNDEKGHPSLSDLQSLTHTVAYISWYKGRSGILWYQPNRQPTHTSRKHVAASLAYRTISTDQSETHSNDGNGREFGCALYF